MEPQRSFQNRTRRIKNDGADFEAFVFECFRVATEEAGFAKRLASGRDGAIDLIDRASERGAATVAECKYIGSGSAVEAVARWRQVAANLRTHLPALARDPRKSPRSPYRGWLDADRPVIRYRFCVTAEMSDQELASLERQIAADFRDLVSMGVESLNALAANADNNVRVLRWDWFEAELDAHPSLAFRWFRGLPVGVELFELETGTSATFRDFLRAGELRYFSRDEYEGRGLGSLERRESDLAAALAGSNQALVITGPGGVGKTRLTWELASKLGADFGFDVYSLGRSADFDAVIELVANYSSNSRILFLVDYAEATTALSRIADAIAHLSLNTAHKIRLIATCRASAVNQVKDALTILTLEEKSLGSVRAGEAAYVQWVAQSILAVEDLPSPDEIDRVCHGVPALAAFAIFLYRRHPHQFNSQFGALHEVLDFDRWAAHRISALVARINADPREAQHTLARIALALPIGSRSLQALEIAHPLTESLVGMLRDDRWIEGDGDWYLAAHDVLADALAARWLFEADSAATGRTQAILDDAASTGDLGNALISLERLAFHPSFLEINGLYIVESLISRFPDEIATSLGFLLSGSLLSLDEKLELIGSSPLVGRSTRVDRSLEVPLSALADQVAKRGPPSEKNAGIVNLIEMLDHAVSQTQTSNLVLRRAYALAPARFRELILRDISLYPKAETTHFLIVQMLRCGESPVSLERSVRYWCEHNSKAWRASYLYDVWLTVRGDINAVSGAILDWISEYEATREASYVYKAWLDSGGDPESVADPLLRWVKTHEVAEDASFVYTAWVNARGRLQPIAASVLRWISKHGKSAFARFAFESWLTGGGEVDSIWEALSAWLEDYGSDPSSRYIYWAWVHAGLALTPIEQSMMKWFAANRDLETACYCYESWLRAGGSPASVSEHLLAWIAEHGTSRLASRVYPPWLRAGGQLQLVETALLEWLARHGAEPEADYVYASWLESGGKLETIEEPLNGWLRRWSESEEFVYLSKTLSRQKLLPEPIILAIARWCVVHVAHGDALYRLSSVVGHLAPEAVSPRGFRLLLATVETALAHSDLKAETDRTHFWAICSALGRMRVFNHDPFGITRVAAAMIARGKIFDPELDPGPLGALNESRATITQLALYALRWGMLRLETHHEGLAWFAAWLRGWEQENGISPRLTDRLDAEFPSSIWHEPESC